MDDRIKRYLATLPERAVRSVIGLGAGMAREVGDVALPKSVRQSRLYQNLVDTTLRFLIERVGEVEGVYSSDEKLADNFLARRTVGNAVEALGLVAFRASPVWVLAALADVCGLGRRLIPEIAASLKEQHLLDAETEFTSVDQLLDGLERTSARLAQTINTPPLDVAALREEWRAIRDEAQSLTPERLPSGESVMALWTDLKAEAARQETSVYQTSSMLALSAIRALPQNARWLGASAVAGATRTGQVLAASLLEQYRETLGEVRRVGYTKYATRQLRPYVRAAAGQFAPGKSTLTGRLLERRKRKPS
jgi:predicted nuclease with TOPRIM domain